MNLTHLRLVSSMFLAMLVVVYRRMVAAHGTVKLCGLHRAGVEVFGQTKLDMVFEIYEDEQTALHSF